MRPALLVSLFVFVGVVCSCSERVQRTRFLLGSIGSVSDSTVEIFLSPTANIGNIQRDKIFVISGNTFKAMVLIDEYADQVLKGHVIENTKNLAAGIYIQKGDEVYSRLFESNGDF